MNCSMPSFPDLHYLPEFAQTQVHWHELVILSNYLILSCPLLLLPSIFPSIRVFFPMSQLFASVGQSIENPASVSVLLINVQGLFPLRYTGLMSLLFKELSIIFSNTTVLKSFLQCSTFFMVQLSCSCMTTGKTIALNMWILSAKWCLCFLLCCLSLS